MPITTDQIKELRDQTGISVMQCKKALEEAEGDMEKARIILQRKSKEAASKKTDRTLGAGTIASYIHGTGTIGAMVELSCETDFVGKNDEFKALAYDIAMQVAGTDPEFLKRDQVGEESMKKAKEVLSEEVKDKPKDMQEKILEGKLDSYFKDKILLEQPFIKNPEVTINDLVEQAIQKFGEKVEITRFARFAI